MSPVCTARESAKSILSHRLKIEYFTISGLDLPNLHFSLMIKSKVISADLSAISLLPTEKTSQACRYSYDKCLDENHASVPYVHSYTDKIRQIISAEWNDTHFFHIAALRKIVLFPGADVLLERRMRGCLTESNIHLSIKNFYWYRLHIQIIMSDFLLLSSANIYIWILIQQLSTSEFCFRIYLQSNIFSATIYNWAFFINYL